LIRVLGDVPKGIHAIGVTGWKWMLRGQAIVNGNNRGFCPLGQLSTLMIMGIKVANNPTTSMIVN
jgi:hypothetical protein